MPDNTRQGQATAFVNALQHILDTLVKESPSDEMIGAQIESEASLKPTNTYELYVDLLDPKALSSLLICITLVSAMHHTDGPGES